MEKERNSAEWSGGWFRKFWEKQLFKRKLRRMDELWRMTGGNCFGLFPPSFYYTHTKEEAEQIKRKEIEKLKEIAAQMEWT